jgi:hypothetical protein
MKDAFCSFYLCSVYILSDALPIDTWRFDYSALLSFILNYHILLFSKTTPHSALGFYPKASEFSSEPSPTVDLYFSAFTHKSN